MSQTAALPIDHLVLPTANLVVARQRLTTLGFTVAPDGIHPFGTVNCCVYLADGTFFEPLAVGDPGLVAEAIDAANEFVSRDAGFRKRHGEEGFSALVLSTEDAEAEHRRYVASGISGGKILDFSRPFVNAAGEEDKASFRLAFAARSRDADAFFFACQRLNVPKVDRSTLQRHANGALRLARVVAVDDAPGQGAGLIADITGSEAVEDGPDSVSLDLPNGAITVTTPQNFAAQFGVLPAGNGTRLAAAVFGVQSLAASEAYLIRAGIAFEHRFGRIVVPAAAGQGAVFAFEEMS